MAKRGRPKKEVEISTDEVEEKVDVSDTVDTEVVEDEDTVETPEQEKVSEDELEKKSYLIYSNGVKINLPNARFRNLVDIQMFITSGYNTIRTVVWEGKQIFPKIF